MTLKFKPLFDRVVVQKVEEDKSPGGILLPDAVEKPFTGKVISVGNGQQLENGEIIPLVVKVNDQVLFQKHNGVEVTIQGQKYLILKESEILGILA